MDVLSIIFPYIISSLFLTVLSLLEFLYSNDLIKYKIRIICQLFFLFFFGFRGFVAWDWQSYYPLFVGTNMIETYGDVENIISNTNFEVGYLLYMSVVKTLFDNWNVFIFVSVFIDLMVFDYLFKKYSPNYALSMLILFSMSIAMEYDLLRNVKAIIIIIVSFKFIVSRNLLAFLLMVLCASFFHSSSIFFLPLYFIGNFRFSKNQLLILFFICISAYFLNIGFGKAISLFLIDQDVLSMYMSDKLIGYYYSDLYGASRSISIGFVQKVIVYLMLILLYDKIVDKHSYGKLISNMYVLYFIMIFSCFDFKILVDRIEYIYGISVWILWPYILYSLCRKSNQLIFLLFVCLLCFVKNIVIPIQNNPYYNYENVLFGSQTYNQRLLNNT